MRSPERSNVQRQFLLAVLVVAAAAISLGVTRQNGRQEEPTRDQRLWLQALELLSKRDMAVVPVLKTIFETTENPLLKRQAAIFLARLDDPNGGYFEFFAKPAREAVEEDVPSPVRLDANGAIQSGLSDSFLAWCAARGVTPDDGKRKVAEWTMAIGALVDQGDRRARDIFLKGVQGLHPLIVSKSAKGLAVLGDEQALRLIRDAARRVPAALSESIAVALFYLEDPAADEAAREFILDADKFAAFRQGAIQENKERRENTVWEQ